MVFVLDPIVGVSRSNVRTRKMQYQRECELLHVPDKLLIRASLSQRYGESGKVFSITGGMFFE